MDYFVNGSANKYTVQNSYAPDAVFNASGLFVYTPLIVQLIEIVRKKYDYLLPIVSIYGSPKVLWNGGRLILKDFCYNNLSSYEKEFVLLSQYKIVPSITFTNHLIQKKDLADKECNKILELLEEHKGNVILSSDILREYISEKYSNIKIYASVIKTTIEDGKGNFHYYKLLEKNFDTYVIHPDDNFNHKLFEGLDLNKVEILLNERCFYGCLNRKQHYETIAREQICQTENIKYDGRFLDQCSAIPETKQSSSQKRNLMLTLNEVRELYSLGVRRFKLQGRADNIYLYFYDLIRYLLDDQMAAPTVYAIMCGHIESYITRGKYERY
ncbi:hypothetical protein [Pelosinus sp. sgz500959]|uniref:hypothetical protein n=1 Tax=Pelosinus sp. sgz500959 TaxID=3242472 RepID=UPI0036713131